MIRSRALLAFRYSMATVLAFVLFGALSCSENTSAPEAEPANVAVETANSVQKIVGPDGGTLTTTSGAGIAYTLEIPAGALLDEFEIAMTPVTSIKGIPYAGGLEGAVQLQPSGLNLLTPAVLTIGATAAPTAEQSLVGFLYEGDAAAFELAAGGEAGGEMRVMVSHFSGAGAALANPGDIGDCEALGSGEPLSIVITMCVGAGDRTAFLDVMQRYFDDLIEPAVRNGSGDGLQDGIRDYLAWRGIVEGGLSEVYNAGDAETVFADRILSLETTIDTKIRDGIAAAKADCTPGELQWLIEVFEYRALAIAVFEGLPSGLDDLIFADLCASAIVESTDLADPLPQNQDRSLDIDFALDINGTPTDAVFSVTVADPDNLVRTPSGRTDAQGRYTTVVRRLIEEGANFDVGATLILPLFGVFGLALVEVPITVEDQVFRGGNARITTDLPATVAPLDAFFLRIQIERLTREGYVVVPNADVTLSVQGGSAFPDHLTSDGTGSAATELIASDGAVDLIVDIAVSLDGASLGSKRVEAAIVAGGIVLRENTHSFMSTFAPFNFGACTGSGDEPQYDDDGQASLSSQVDEHCDNPLQITTTRSAFASLITNPGLAPDNRSMVATLQSSGNLYANVDACVDPDFCNDISSSATVIFQLEFDVVGADMNFEFDASRAWDAAGISSSTITLTRQSGPSPHIINWNGNPSEVLLVGNLTPGYYVFNYVANLYATASPGGEAQTVTWNTGATLTIAPAPNSTEGNGR